MKSKLRLFLCLLLTICLGCASYWDVLTQNTYAYLGVPMQTGHPMHGELSFSELPFIMPDLSGLSDRAEALLARTKNGEDARQLQTELDSLLSEWEDADTMAALAYAHYSLDVTDPVWRERNDLLSASLDPIYGTLIRTALLLSERTELSARYDENTVAALQTAVLLFDPAIASYSREEQALVGQYNLLQSTLTVQAQGQEWTYADLMNDETLPFAQWYEIYQTYATEAADRAGELYRKLIAVRNALAETLGFSNYAEYRYAVYGRDYSPKEAAAFSTAVQDRLTEPFTELLRQTAIDRELLYYADTYPEAETMERIGIVMEKLLPMLSEPWTYMRRNRLWNASSLPHKLAGSYTTFFAAYGAPFLVTTWDDTAAMPSTVLHEFGHFAGYYFRWENGDAAGGSLDLAEVDSQGLELLALPFYPELFGNRADEARSVKYADMLYAIQSGCAADAFEQYAYAHPDVSVAALHAYFGTLVRAYGLDKIGFTETTWTEIMHLFQSPFYYISYATSAVAALELSFLQQQDGKKAIEVYRKVLLRETDSGFREMLRKCDLTDPLSDDTISMLVQNVANSDGIGNLSYAQNHLYAIESAASVRRGTGRWRGIPSLRAVHDSRKPTGRATDRYRSDDAHYG